MMAMAERPPFDPIKACFYLIAAILGTHCLVVLIGLLFCVWYGQEIVAGSYKCSNIGVSMGELLSGALAAALAFSAGFNRKKD